MGIEVHEIDPLKQQFLYKIAVLKEQFVTFALTFYSQFLWKHYEEYINV